MRRILFFISLVAGFVPGGVRAEMTPSRAQPRSQRARAERALRGLAAGRTLQVLWAAHRARPAVIRGLAEPTPGTSAVERARRFLGRHPGLFPAATPEALALVDLRSAGGSRFVRLQQLHRGLPVDGAQLVVELDEQQRVRSVSSEAEPIELASVTPALDAAAAQRAAAAALQLGPPRAGSARLVILPHGGGRLAYRVLLFPDDPTGRAHLVDAMTGAYLGSRVAAIIEGVRR